MALWTDIIEPAELTGYARESLNALEQRKGTLARWLPNRQVMSTFVRFIKGGAGLVEEARYRAFDAEPEVGRRPAGQRVTIELPAVSQEIPVSEYQQLLARSAGDDALRREILRTTDQVVSAIADRVERTRGVVLNTGKATINQSNFVSDDDFGRAAGLTLTAPALWSVAGTDALGQLQTWFDLYVATNGVAPGAILMSNRALRALGATAGMSTQLLNGASRPATIADVNATVSGAGLPEIIAYSRRTSSGAVIPDTQVLFLPAPVDPNDGETELGATFWGETLTSLDADYAIGDGETPGVVTGVYRNEKPPMIAEVIGDSVNLPVLANANLSMSVKVL